MDDLAISNFITEENSKRVNYNDYLTKTPNFNSKININYFPYRLYCKCRCHCQVPNFLYNI